MKRIQVLGDITFIKDGGKLYQQIKNRKPFPVSNGSNDIDVLINTVKGYHIKYNTNGIYGFSIWRGKEILDNNIWTLEDAVRVRNILIIN